MPKVNMLFDNRGEVEVVTPPSPAPVDWKTSEIPLEIQKDPIWDKYENKGDAFKALVEAQKFLGREKLPVPKDVNDKETYDLIFKKLGLPDNDAGYELPVDLNIPKEFPYDETLVKDFKKIAHENRLLPSQVSNLYKWFVTQQLGAFNKMGDDKVASAEAGETELRKEWGAAYAQNSAIAQKVFRSFAGEKDFAEVEKLGLANNPVMVKLFANIGKVLSEDQLHGKPSTSSMTPAEAQAEINKMNGEKGSPLFDAVHPQHNEYLDKRQRLYEFLGE
jgi:hypothetical protein